MAKEAKVAKEERGPRAKEKETQRSKAKALSVRIKQGHGPNKCWAKQADEKSEHRTANSVDYEDGCVEGFEIAAVDVHPGTPMDRAKISIEDMSQDEKEELNTEDRVYLDESLKAPDEKRDERNGWTKVESKKTSKRNKKLKCCKSGF